MSFQTDSEANGASTELWEECEAMGVIHPSLPQSLGGAELGVANERVVLERAARAALPLPLAETMLAGWLLARCGYAPPSGPLSVAGLARGANLELRDGRLFGIAPRTHWARGASAIVVVVGSQLVLTSSEAASITEGVNLAGEPCDDLTYDGATPSWSGAIDLDPTAMMARGAAMRASQMAGAMSRVMELSLAYVNQRVQFGQPIGRFQAVQHPLAVAASHAAAARMAAIAAYDQLERFVDDAEPFVFCAAMAKARASEAAGITAATAHQVQGAIGVTAEYHLHPFTKRLQDWRGDYGSEAWWQQYIGERVLRRGADALWPSITELTV
ncbi:MAG: acyl-CoA dehydrogenase family protein [Phenylobacterium sp.]|uniref:acyl-CoA dehydrogenase family protein n=1 Tax=Phenylobacterium sp. TaxID=1871053 RepID=UPI002736E8B3|nr:acyl-CoA dehydrogenase family protein [Phenylobacterium sp.]MDP3173873.1 acyl-CoA dehydrogenase family protein [Phenylobacterium sp.]